MTSLHLTPERPSLLDPSKAALLQYITDRKEPLHNYQQRSIFWDREHLYKQNLSLRSKLKELSQTNTKTKTQLLKSQKQIVDLTNSRILVPATSIYRSASTHRFKQDRELATFRWKADAVKEEERSKKMLFIRQQVRKLKEEVERLHSENAELKQSMKYTRMSELQTENRELQEELLRLRQLVSDTTRAHEEMYRNYLREKEETSGKVRREVENRGLLVRELKRVNAVLEQVRNQNKEGKTDRKLMLQIKSLKKENSQLKETIEVGMRTNAFRVPQSGKDLTKLQYSTSAFDYHNTERKLFENSAPAVQNRIFNMPSDLTSLQLLTPKVTIQEFRSPQKPNSAVLPSNLISEQGLNEEMEESLGGFTIKKEQEPAVQQKLKKKDTEQVVEDYKKQGYQSSQYQYIMEQV